MKTTQRDGQITHFDFIVVGGGLSGCLTALALSRLKRQSSLLSIAVIEPQVQESGAALSFDSRVLALSHGSASYLNELSVWPDIQTKANPIEEIHISDRGNYGKARIYAKDHQVDEVGYVVEMSLLGDAIFNAAKRQANISWFMPDEICNIQMAADKATVALKSGSMLSTPLMIACDGGQSYCRKWANIESSAKDYEQVAVIANVEMAKAHANKAFERFTDTGPIAMLPLTDNKGSDSAKCSLVWSLTPQQATNVMALSDEAFKSELAEAFGFWLGHVKRVGQRASYPLKLIQANEQVSHRLVLVGNASHTIHPIAGQGFNLGLRDVKALADHVNSRLGEESFDFGQLAFLMNYASERQEDHGKIIKLTDSLVTLFSNDLMPLVVGRNIGLKALNYITPAKQAFVRKTMGY